MLLRNIYDIMLREISDGRGSLGNPMLAFKKAFNVTVMSMVRKTHPRRANIVDGTLVLTSKVGREINDMYAGRKQVAGPPTSHRMYRYGKKSPAEMKLEHTLKMKKFAILLRGLRDELPDNMPDRSPTRIP